LLLHGTYLGVKLANCAFCLTVSDYNRRYILRHYRQVQPVKVMVSRLGAEVLAHISPKPPRIRGEPFTLLAVGRLHAVKDHRFLIRACAQLAARGLQFECSIAGDGPERRALKSLIRKYGLERQVMLLGHVPREQMDSLYDRSNVVVLTSRSEGVPLVLMEAMARGKIVVAPAITGIPELVISEKTGFLYKAGSLEDFVAKILLIHSMTPSPTDRPSHTLLASRQLDRMRYAARVQVRNNFNRKTNLESFADLFLQWIAPGTESDTNENFVLQQVQLSIQRHRSVFVRADGIAAVAGASGRAVFDG
jgi:glycosyltransferase involved in cell wall biosynthesis